MPDRSSSPGLDNPPVAVAQTRLSPISALSTAATVLIVLNVLAAAVVSWAYWHSYQVVRDYFAGVPGVTEADLATSDRIDVVVVVIYAGLLLAAGIVFIVWLWRARRNAEILCAARHRRARGWIVGGWVCPIVNLWFPHMVVTDVWNASKPSTPPNHLDLTTMDRSWTVNLWWLGFLGSSAASWYAQDRLRAQITPDLLREAAIADTTATAAWVVAAVFIIRVMWKVTRWQSTPRPLGDDQADRAVFGA